MICLSKVPKGQFLILWLLTNLFRIQSRTVRRISYQKPREEKCGSKNDDNGDDSNIILTLT